METTIWKGQTIPVHLKDSDHKWMKLRPGHPQVICKCGEMRVRRMRSGDQSIIVGAVGGVDIIRFTAGSAAAVLGDLSMSVTDGRPNAFIDDISTALVGRYEVLGDRKLVMLRNQLGSTTLSSFGFDTTGLTQNGGGGIVVNAVAGDGEYIQFTSAAAAGSDAGWVSPANSGISFGFTPLFTALIRTGAAVTGIRIWIALSSVNPMASDAPAGDLMGFRFSTGAADVNWQAVTAVGGVSTVTDTGVSVTAATSYYLTVLRDNSASRIIFRIVKVGGGAPVLTTIATNVPTASANLFNVQARNLAGVAVVLNISHLLITQLPGYVRG